jgi:DNA-binding IclR family transcriptional regulator
MKRKRASTAKHPAIVEGLRHGIDVLRSFTLAEPVLGVTQIARRLGSSPSSVYRALFTLEDAGLAERDPATGRYRLAPGVVALAGPLLGHLSARDVARPHLERLAEESGESVGMSLWNRIEAVNVEQVAGPRVIQHLAPLGRRVPPHASAAGKVLLAHAPPGDLEAVLARGLVRYTDRTITDPARLLADLDQVRNRDYGVNDRELEPELVVVAAPLRDHRNRVVAAISVAAPSYRAQGEQIERLTGLVVGAAFDISRRLGFSGRVPGAPATFDAASPVPAAPSRG